MTSEALAEIETRLAARKLGVKFERLSVDSSPALLDVEDGFLEDNMGTDLKPAVKSISLPSFDSEPE